MNTRAQWLQRHELVPYLTLAFAISWIGVLAFVGLDGFPGTEEAFLRLIVPVVAAMLLGPSVAGIAATALTHGRAGLRDLLARATKWRVDARWYGVALFTAPVVAVANVSLLGLFDPVFRAGLATAEAPVTHLLLGLLTGAAAGFFEEIGWTGFAIPIMRKRLTPTQTGLVLGVIWGAWHTLTSLWGGWTAEEVPMALFLPVVLFSFLVPYRVLMVWVYERTHSVLVAMVMHGALTASVRIFDPVRLSGWDAVTYNATLGLGLWCVVAVVALRRRSATPPR